MNNKKIPLKSRQANGDFPKIIHFDFISILGGMQVWIVKTML